MLRSLRAAAITGPIVAGFLLIGADYDPQVLTLRWSSGHEERIPATSTATCETAVRAIRSGLWMFDRPPTTARCSPGNLFPERSLCIAGFNCRRAQ